MDINNVNTARSERQTTGRPTRLMQPVVTGHGTPVLQRPPRLRLSPVYKVLIGSLGLVLLAVVTWLFILAPATLYIDRGKYQALFLTNGEVYFGTLHDVGFGHMVLSDVYYIQAQTTTNIGTTGEVQNATGVTQGQAKLLKLGSEVHGPDGKMIVRKDQILYFENLKADSQVTTLINQDKN